MQAAFYEATGPAREVLHLGQMELPQPGPGEVRVRVVCSGVNPSDVKGRAGLRNKVLPFPRIVPHSDGAGIVDAVGTGVAAPRVGERVWLWNGAWKRAWGTAAEYVVLPAPQAVHLPDNVGYDAGACLGIPALTAYQAAAVDGGVVGRSVLVAGGAGAVGHYAIQCARLLGARQVISTVSSDAKARLALDAGADLAVDYRSGDAAERVRAATGGAGVDRIIEVDIAANAALDLQVLKPGGDIVVYGSGAGEFKLPFFPLILNNVRLRFFIVYELPPADRAQAQAHVGDWLRRGALRHNVAARFPLARIAEAHELVEWGQATGNVVVECGQP
ncbi:NADPH:quinone reductase [Ramlibacter sp.]|uniref:NADPH:quinone reductase n=1 Tax=Ramlibacter sp. TaxID=1917967 RepID=UPI002B584654|nr:NADPH:quinone reductase [Ramlibacter sp.]HWI82880.1 NADPH:quinone reductase [Ramlibacter sp.]